MVTVVRGASTGGYLGALPEVVHGDGCGELYNNNEKLLVLYNRKGSAMEIADNRYVAGKTKGVKSAQGIDLK